MINMLVLSIVSKIQFSIFLGTIFIYCYFNYFNHLNYVFIPIFKEYSLKATIVIKQ